MIIRMDQPLANDHQDAPALCKFLFQILSSFSFSVHLILQDQKLKILDHKALYTKFTWSNFLIFLSSSSRPLNYGLKIREGVKTKVNFRKISQSGGPPPPLHDIQESKCHFQPIKVGFKSPKTMATKFSHTVQKSRIPIPPLYRNFSFLPFF